MYYIRHVCNAERKGCRMKIEKVNENQIRCTLTREDLASRELKISELAYGTEKAKTLFRDMMRQANFEFGFEAEDIPLMIEAIPLNAECIVLIITKVEDPEELDTRFSRFAPSVTEDDPEEYESEDPEEVLNLFRKLQTSPEETDTANAATSQADEPRALSRVFQMSSLQQVMNVCQLIASNYDGMSTLYKDDSEHRYFLMLTADTSLRDNFDRICNVLSEYGSLQRSSSGSESYLSEHCEALVCGDAVHALGGR